MKFTGQKHFDQKTSVFTLINLFTQHQCKTNLNRSPVIQIFLLSVTCSALVVASNFLFALQLSKVEPLLQSVAILHQSSVLLLYYCLSKGKDEPLMHDKDVSLPSCSCGCSWQSQIFSHNKKQSEPRKDVNRKARKGVWPPQKWGSRMQTVLACLRRAGRIQLQLTPYGASSICLLQKRHWQLSGQSQVVFCGQSIVLCVRKSGKDFHAVLAKRVPTLISK